MLDLCTKSTFFFFFKEPQKLKMSTMEARFALYRKDVMDVKGEQSLAVISL